MGLWSRPSSRAGEPEGIVPPLSGLHKVRDPRLRGSLIAALSEAGYEPEPKSSETPSERSAPTPRETARTAREFARRYAPERTLPLWMARTRQRTPLRDRLRTIAAWTATIIVAGAIIAVAAHVFVALPLQREDAFVARQ